MTLGLLIRTNIHLCLLRPVYGSRLFPLSRPSQRSASISKTSFIENYLQQDLDDFRAKFASLLGSSSHSKDYPFSIQSEVEVDILDVINSGTPSHDVSPLQEALELESLMKSALG